MKTNKKGIQLIHSFESCELSAYLCPARKWTIGYGNTFYADGSAVKAGDKITQAQADELFVKVLSGFEKKVDALVKPSINENQFSALVSFAYNCGVANLQSSTLLKRVNANPNDTDIERQFLRWNKGGGKVLNGLTRRRQAEADLYFS
ncbi:lysozyme [Pontibacter rugosus]|uniref:Lysozyme n=1 Tax=Pontibacter rugosus TaxID=1745966 RepID=A0ABW3SK06_9BACT